MTARTDNGIERPAMVAIPPSTYTIEWEQVRDEHNWSAKIGNVYKLRVLPGISPFGVIHYHAQVCNVALDELAVELNLPTVEIAKQRAVYLTWKHNFDIGDALLTAL